MMMWMKLFLNSVFGLSLLLFLLGSEKLSGQNKTDKLELAEEYFKRENYEKALELYEDIKGNAETDRRIFAHYLTCLDKLKPGKADAASRKFLKRYPGEQAYFIIHYQRLQKEKSREAYDFAKDRLLPFYLSNGNAVREGFAFFTEGGDSASASALLEAGLKKYGPSEFWEIRLEQVLQQKKYQAAASLILELIAENLLEITEIQGKIQEKMAISLFSKELQMAFLKRIQLQPGNTGLPAFLAWIYMQKGDYSGALQQYLALDLLEGSGGARCYQLGEFAANASDDKAAIRCFETIINRFPTSQYRYLSQQKCMQLKEQVVRNTFPVNKAEVRQLITEYRDLKNSQFLNAWEITMKIAELQGKYLNHPDSAILELESSMQTMRWPPSFLNRAKILLADMYVLKDEPWEASLLYGQVEKDEAESLTGYEAKLKNARVFYYKGEFELCKEILDVLKQSTSRDISNDAIELGLLLHDILAEDTTGFILSKFAEIDLLTYQGNYPESIDRIEKLAFTTSNPVVMEKLRFRLFKNFEATRQFDKALSELDQIYQTKASDLYLDDALFFSGMIYAEQKKDKEKAMEYFLTLIKEKPGSVYVAEARKRLRLLRGDFTN
jgi:outer membrane protein assembly factor BamD (BamD/ComL family)